MSASLYYRPISNQHHITNSAKGTIDKLQKVFGALPLRLDHTHIEKLSVMARLEDDDQNNPYQKIIEAIDEFSEIEIFAEY